MIVILYIAALIAAIALLVIAIYLGKTLKSTSQTMDEVAKSLEKNNSRSTRDYRTITKIA